MKRIVNKFKDDYLKFRRFLGTSKNDKDALLHFGYETCATRDSVTVLKPKKGRKQIIAMLDSVVVCASLTKNNKSFDLYPDYRFKSVYYKINLTPEKFPDLLEDSYIANVLLLRYLRKVNQNQTIKSWRLVVVTDKSQIYHNFPATFATDSEYEGATNVLDIDRFVESVVWDLPERRYPSKNKKCRPFEIYYPGLPNECYEYHPAIKAGSHFGDHTFVDGENDKMVAPRFYFPKRSIETNPFVFMGGFTNDNFMTTIGTYRNNVGSGVRTCVFFSDDGGRQWFNKYEFGDFGEYRYLKEIVKKEIIDFGNAIRFDKNLCDLTSLHVSKRIINTKSYEMIQEKCFNWIDDGIIDRMWLEDTIVCRTSKPHMFASGNIVAFYSNTQNDFEYSWMLTKRESIGNGPLFKVQVVSSNTFKIYEYAASATNPICCRHIHHINRQKDGWLIGTGEVYPNSWLIFLQNKEKDKFVNNSSNAKIKFKEYYLNSVETSIQRTIGAEFVDDDLLVYASDHPDLPLNSIAVNGHSFDRASLGIFIGKISESDNRTRFKCIYDSNEVGYFFKRINGIWIYGGQLGEVAISRNLNNWSVLHLDQTLRCYQGDSNSATVIDGIVFLIG